MAVLKKDPGKPGYMSTEFWGMVLFGLHTLGSKAGLSSEQVDQTVSSFSDLIDGLGDNPTQSIMLGLVVIAYTAIRGWLKKTQIVANAKIAMTKVNEEVK